MGDDVVQKCDKCKITLQGDYRVCPLCGSIIQSNEGNGEDVFPSIPTIYQEFNIFIRLLIFLSIAAVVISFAINVIFTRDSKWSILVAAGIACMWLSLFVIIRKKNNIPKTILWQVFLIGILSVLWDFSMGWRGWSIDYVIPAICVGAMIVMAIAAKLLKIGVRDLIVYLMVDVLFGFIPIIFLLFHPNESS